MNPLKNPIRLAEGRVESLSDLVNLLFEYGLFFKWIYFKNRPRGNLLFLRSTLMVGAYALIFFYFFYDFGLVLEGIEIDPVIALTGATIIGYWHMTSTFYKKSKSCNDLNVEILKAVGREDHKTVELFSNALAIELLTLDLWAHRKFSSIFSEEIYKAIDCCYEEKSKFHPNHYPESKEEMFEFVNRGKLQAKEARKLLNNRRNLLISGSRGRKVEKLSA